MRRTGLWIPVTAVALATAVLWIAVGLRNEVQHELATLLDRVGANVFCVNRTDRSRVGAEALAEFAALPEVAEVAGEGSTTTGVVPEETYTLTYFEVSPEYFDVMRLPLALGVAYSVSDGTVAVLGAEVASVVFGGENPIGQEIDGLEIIGVLDEIPSDDSIREKVNRCILVPAGAAPNPPFFANREPFWAVWIRANGPIDDAIQAVEREFPDWTVRRASERYETVFSMETSVNRLLALSSIGLFLLAGTIVSGTLSLSALSRRREIGVRLAVGARGGSIVGLLVRDALALTSGAGLAGVAVGLIASPVAKEFGIGLRLGGIHLIVVPLILVIGVISSLIPGWRNARLTPVRALSSREGEDGRTGSLGIGFVIVAVSAAIGTCALYVLLSMATATDLYLRDLLGDVDERTVSVAAPRQSILAAPRLMADDVTLLKSIPGVDLAVPVSELRAELVGVDAAGRSMQAVGTGYAQMHYLPIVAGRDLQSEEIEAGTRSVVLSSDAAGTIFGGGDPMGQSVSLNGKRYTVVGVFGSDALSVSRGVWMVVPFRSYSTEQRDYDEHMFWVRMEAGAIPAVVTAAIREALGAEYPGTADVEITVPSALLGEMRASVDGIGLRLGLLIAAALFLGGANTFNLIQFHLALQRRELGIRRAIGATESSIVWLGSGQGLRVALLAALIGLSGGVFAVGTLGGVLGLPMSAVGSRNLTTGLASILALGLLAGTAAGRSATTGLPADALRRGRE